MQLQAPGAARIRFHRRPSPSVEYYECQSISGVEGDIHITSKPSQVELLTGNVLEARKERDDDATGSFFYRITKTFMLYFAFFSLGSCNAVVGPSLPDFQSQVRESLQKTSFVFTARSAGYLIGSVVGGACFDRYENQLLLALCSLGAAIFGVLVAFSNTFALLISIIAIWGFFSGFQETGINFACVKIWKDSGPWIQGLNFFYAVGGTVAPLIAGPFLTSSISVNSTSAPPLSSSQSAFEKANSSFGTSNKMHYVTNDSYRSENGSYYESLLSSIDPTLQVITGEKDESSLTQIKFDEANYELGRLWIPYSIIAAFNLTVAVSFFWLFARGSRRIAIPKRRPYPTALNQTETVKNNRLFRIVILVLMFFFYFAYIGNEIVYSGFIYTFAIRSDLGFTTKSASYLNSAFWGGFAVVCALGIPSSIFLSAKTMLIIDLSGICISSILLAAFGDKNKAGLWGATILLGASMATLFQQG
ncbi:sodium-dependent glucose transporter 1A-like [Ptychodera flava]|uniref:sodium-dependent glucose transporter 1A-like n=1 Tax=Ptychodera flava TaxID=63121 RepID=UPI00396A186E